MQPRFEQFIREKQYLTNVTPATASWYTYSLAWLRSVFHLKKVLGHSTLEMTRRYANLMTEDLQTVHEQVSLLTQH